MFWHVQKYFSLLIKNDLVWPHSVVDIAFAWFQSTSVVISLKLMLHVISVFFNPFDFISSCCRFLWQSLRKLRHQLSRSNWLKVFRTLKLYDNFHVMTFFAKKRHDIFILGFLQLKPDSNCGKIEGQKSKKRKPENCGKYVHMYIASTRRA